MRSPIDDKLNHKPRAWSFHIYKKDVNFNDIFYNFPIIHMYI